MQKQRFLPAAFILVISIFSVLTGCYAPPHADFPDCLSPANCELAVQANPDDADAWRRWGDALSMQAFPFNSESSDTFVAQACEKYEQAVWLKPSLVEAWMDWGTLLYYQAMAKYNYGISEFYASDIERVERDKGLQPEPNDWNTQLAGHRQRPEFADADALLAQAYEKFAQATMYKPDYELAWNYWGQALRLQAWMTLYPASCYSQACNIYAQATAINFEAASLWEQWGETLAQQASRMDYPAARTFYNQAYEKYAQATTLDPECKIPWKSWGSTLRNQSYREKDEDAWKILNQQAEEKLKRASRAKGTACNR